MRIPRGLITAYSNMGQKGAFSGVGMVQAAENEGSILSLVADSVSIASLDRFQTMFPDRVINVGIAEQNLIGVAAGIASEGLYKPYAFTYAEFLVLRAYEQIRQNLSYNSYNVKLIGNSAGFVMGPLGVSHWATEDIALMRAIPNIKIFSPADSLEAIKIALALPDIEGPAYVRLSGGLNCPVVYDKDFDYTPGKANLLREGTDAVIIATGLMVRESLDAAALLEPEGIRCAVMDMHTIEPLDKDALDEAFEKYPLLITVEEHRRTGGLGSAVIEHKNERGAPVQTVVLGAGSTYAKLGSQRYIWEQYGLTNEKIAESIKSKLEE